MHRIITPVVFLVCLLEGLTFLHAQADQKPDYFLNHSIEFEEAIRELNREIVDVELGRIAVGKEHIWKLAVFLSREQFDKAARINIEAPAILFMLSEALEELEKTREHLLYTRERWETMANKANQLDVGHPRKYFSGADRAELAALALQVRSGIEHTHAAHLQAQEWEEMAYDFLPRTLLHQIKIDFVLEQHQLAGAAIGHYVGGCIGDQARRIVGIVVANLHAFISDEPEGEVNDLTAHPSYPDQNGQHHTVFVDISDAFKVERDGKTKRSLRVGFEIPYDAQFAGNVEGAAGELLARQHDLLATKHNLKQEVPDYAMAGDIFQNDGNGLTLHYRLLESNLAQTYAGEYPDRLVAGQSDSCPLTLETTGSPQQIAKQIAYGITLVGAQHISLGSDFDGAVTTGIDTSEIAIITQELIKLGISTSNIKRVMGDNMKNFLLKQLPEE